MIRLVPNARNIVVLLICSSILSSFAFRFLSIFILALDMPIISVLTRFNNNRLGDLVESRGWLLGVRGLYLQTLSLTRGGASFRLAAWCVWPNSLPLPPCTFCKTQSRLEAQS